jgi:lipid-binding SYLF domain-containing protein
MRKMSALLIALTLAALTWPVHAFEPDANDRMELDVQRAIISFKKADPGIESFFESAAGYAVFPGIGKGGFVIGGAYGKGLVIVDEKVDGYTSMSQATIGLQLGGQKYAQIIFFKDETAIGHFRRGNFEFGAQASAVAITAGASATAAYNSGVAVFTRALGGLMFEGSIGGQRFKFTPKAP